MRARADNGQPGILLSDVHDLPTATTKSLVVGLADARCTQHKATRSIQCTQLQLIHTVFEAIDVDRNKRRIGPVSVLKYGQQYGHNSSHHSQGVKPQGCSCQKHFARFDFLLETGHEYNLRSFGSMPGQVRLLSMSKASDAPMLMHLFYTSPSEVMVYAAGAAVPASTDVSSFDMSQLSSYAAGANVANPQARVVSVVLKGGVQEYRFITTDVIQVTQTIKMTAAQFYCDNNLNKFVSTIQLLLGKAKVAVVCVTPPGGACIRPEEKGTLDCGRKARHSRSTDTVAIDFKITPTAVTSSDVGTGNKSPEDQAKALVDVATKLSEAASSGNLTKALEAQNLAPDTDSIAKVTSLPSYAFGYEVSHSIKISGGVALSSSADSNSSLAAILQVKKEEDAIVDAANARLLAVSDADTPTSAGSAALGYVYSVHSVRIYSPCTRTDAETIANETTAVQNALGLQLANGVGVVSAASTQIYYIMSLTVTMSCQAMFQDLTVKIGVTSVDAMPEATKLLSKAIVAGHVNPFSTGCTFITGVGTGWGVDFVGCAPMTTTLPLAKNINNNNKNPITDQTPNEGVKTAFTISYTINSPVPLSALNSSAQASLREAVTVHFVAVTSFERPDIIQVNLQNSSSTGGSRLRRTAEIHAIISLYNTTNKTAVHAALAALAKSLRSGTVSLSASGMVFTVSSVSSSVGTVTTTTAPSSKDTVTDDDTTLIVVLVVFVVLGMAAITGLLVWNMKKTQSNKIAPALVPTTTQTQSQTAPRKVAVASTGATGQNEGTRAQSADTNVTSATSIRFSKIQGEEPGPIVMVTPPPEKLPTHRYRPFEKLSCACTAPFLTPTSLLQRWWRGAVGSRSRVCSSLSPLLAMLDGV